MNFKKFIPVLYVAGFLIMAGSIYAFKNSTEGTYTKIDPPHWKNLKVLPQDISRDSLFGLMKGYSKSLGVHCDYCHAPMKDDAKKLDFAEDSKLPKEIARGMIKMTDEINENYFKPHYPDPKPNQVSDVQCILCHRGTPNPEEYLGAVGSFYQNKKEEHHSKPQH
ncbi:c-type cytochrome [Zhouia sp. PK063]|uniref:c-type cytochrome n=1 Tax=Zhouia sp. PK063 TaxID=3373602 RepID=UPI0037B8F768